MPELDDAVQLRVENVHMAFGGIAALKAVSLDVRRGEIFSVIGPNGAGKTVLLNCINGLYFPQRGKILFEGKDITPLRPYRRARLGISRTFQKIELFRGMTVLDNIRLGRHLHLRTGLLDGGIYVGRSAREEIASREFQEIKQKLLFQLTNFGQPIVDVLDGNYENRGALYLIHRHEGMDLPGGVRIEQIDRRGPALTSVIADTGRNSGNVMRRKVVHSFAPRSMAASSRSESKPASPAATIKTT